MKRTLAIILCGALMLSLSACGGTSGSSSPAPSESPQSEIGIDTTETTAIVLSDEEITVNGEPASDDSTAAVYTAHDIVFYLEGQDITYGEGTQADAHSQDEAEAHTVVHITQPGTYTVSGSLSAGQIAIDLGEEAEEDPEAVVTLILNSVDITCTVAPAVIFYNVYECGDKDTPTETVDTAAAGARVVIADGSVNNISGSYVARIYKPDSVELSADGTEVIDSKKLHKYDAAFYSKMSMNVDGGEAGTGILNIQAENEGLDSELHLTVDGGNINITSGNDGMNTNEDGVSVTTINGGFVRIRVTGETGEGDGIDSNGWLVINGGTVEAAACGFSGDAGIDSDMGIYLNGGTVLATGNMLDRIAGSQQNYAVFTFQTPQSAGTVYTLKNVSGDTVAELTGANDYSILIFSSSELTAGDYTLWCGQTQMAAAVSEGDMRGFGGGMRPENGEMNGKPEGFERPEAPEGSMKERPELPEGEGGKMPQGRPNGMGQSQAELSTTLTIQEGANYFTNITVAE